MSWFGPRMGIERWVGILMIVGVGVVALLTR
jgi:hypothetical protein